jgi:ferritin-like protein
VSPSEAVLRHFGYDHLPEPLRAVSRRFYELAHWVAAELPEDPERTTALRKLLEAKDCAVRARLTETRAL